MTSPQASNAVALLPNEEYETQFYGFLPSSSVQGMVLMIEEKIADAIDDLEESLSQIPENILSKADLSKGMEKFKSVINKNTEKTLGKLQRHLLDEVLRLPNHLLLPCDALQSEPADPSQVEAMKNKIADLHTQYSNELYVQASLKAELEVGEKVLVQQEQVLNDILSEDSKSACSSLRDNLRFIQDHRADEIKLLNDVRRQLSSILSEGVVDAANVPSEADALLCRLLPS
ncbi:protein MIS12 homolog [Hyalella azteca]|uniref:Protein MIS12 homolog n=1 Tax=Hyalella azteca TaxID=294128 RepID=A0A8B7P911_HYAAZ|nr:protein MIS12 homolog [Hyalella azteca]